MVDLQSQPLAGKYRLIRELGQGGMGSVWQAEHMTLHAMVAVKLLDPTMAATKDGLSRFLREAQAAASLRSAHIVQILDHGIDRGIPYIAMELLEGESLGSRLDRVSCISPTETARIVRQVARAMTRAHDAGIVHRDLKPDNIFMVPNDDEEVVKVLDFGIAKAPAPLAAGSSDSTRTGTMLGTPYYMSPEQVESATNTDYRSDIWALGVIAYQCILGKRPFDGETVGGLFLAICAKPLPVPSSLGAVPPGFDAWFARACARSPKLRFQSAREAAAELRQVCGQDRTAPISFEPDSGQAAPAFGNTTGQGAAVGMPTTPPPRRAGRSLGLAVTILVVVGVAWQALRSKPIEAVLPTPTNESATAAQPPTPPRALDARSADPIADSPAPAPAPPSSASAASSASTSPVTRSAPPNATPRAPNQAPRPVARPAASSAPPVRRSDAAARGRDVDLGL